MNKEFDSQEILLCGNKGLTLSVTKFTGNNPLKGRIIMNYGFPGDVRNYDLAKTLASQGFEVLIPHPPGIDQSEGEFKFSHFHWTFEACVNLDSDLPVVILSYCYSVIPVLSVIARRAVAYPHIMLAPLLNWKAARKRIEAIENIPFYSFLAMSQHGVRQGFSGVRADPDDLLKEHLNLENVMNSHEMSKLFKPPNELIIYGTRDQFVDVAEIERHVQVAKLDRRSCEVGLIDGSGHHFALHRATLARMILKYCKQF